MATIDDLANDEKYARRASLLGGGETTAPAPQKAALLAPPKPAPTSTQAVPPRSVPFATPPVNPNVQGGVLSADAAKYQASQSAAPAAAAESPILRQAKSIGSTMLDGAKATYNSLVPSLPKADGAIGRMAGSVVSGVGNLAKKAAPLIEPIIEGGRVIQVALDPQSTKADVAQQTVEGAGRWGATVGGAALGGGLGSVTGPGAAIGAALGGIAGYVGGDAAINKIRAAVGLGDKSPIQRTQERQAAQAAQPAPAPAPVAQTAPAPAVQAPAPSAPAPAPAAQAPGQRIRAAAPAPRPAPKTPIQAAVQAADTTGIKNQIGELEKRQAASGLKADLTYGKNGLEGTFTGPDGARFTNVAATDRDKELAKNVSIIDANGADGTVFEQDGKQYRNVAIGTQAGGVPLVKAVSLGGKGDFGHGDAVSAYRDMEDAKLRLAGMTPEQKALADEHVANFGKTKELYGQLNDAGQVPAPVIIRNGTAEVNGTVMPVGVYQSGKAQEYTDAATKGEISGANPQQAKIDAKLAEVAAEGKNQLAVAGTQAGAHIAGARIAADANKYGVDSQAKALKNQIIMQDETVDDGMGGVKVVKRAYKADGTPVGNGQPPQQFVEGQIYTDKSGKKARYKAGNWEPVK